MKHIQLLKLSLRNSGMWNFILGYFIRVEWMNSISSNPFFNILNDIKIILLVHKFPFQLVLIFKTLELSQDSWQQGHCMITMNVSVWHPHFALSLEWTFDSSSFTSLELAFTLVPSFTMALVVNWKLESCPLHLT